MNATNNSSRVVKVEVAGIVRYYIANGLPGCNLRANNLRGWKTAKGAEAASLRCERAWPSNR